MLTSAQNAAPANASAETRQRTTVLITKKGAVRRRLPLILHMLSLKKRQPLLGAGNLAGLEARGADVHLLLVAVDDNGDVLDVRTELTVGDAVRVADRTAGDSVLAANGANLRHCCKPPLSGAWCSRPRHIAG